MAHSDSDAWDVVPHAETRSNGSKRITPVMNDVFTPLTIKEMEVVQSNCNKFMDKIIKDRKCLELELQHYFPEFGVSNEKKSK